MILFLFLLLLAPAWAHSVDYQVDAVNATAVTVRFSDEEPASYSEYELFPPHQTIPFQSGRTDALGRVVFAPDRAGEWTVKVKADSAHGLHGVTMTVTVDDQGVVKSYTRPLVARYTKLFVGAGILLGLFGLASLVRRPGRGAPEAGGPPAGPT